MTKLFLIGSMCKNGKWFTVLHATMIFQEFFYWCSASIYCRKHARFSGKYTFAMSCTREVNNALSFYRRIWVKRSFKIKITDLRNVHYRLNLCIATFKRAVEAVNDNTRSIIDCADKCEPHSHEVKPSDDIYQFMAHLGILLSGLYIPYKMLISTPWTYMGAIYETVFLDRLFALDGGTI